PGATPLEFDSLLGHSAGRGPAYPRATEIGRELCRLMVVVRRDTTNDATPTRAQANAHQTATSPRLWCGLVPLHRCDGIHRQDRNVLGLVDRDPGCGDGYRCDRN